MVKKNKKKTRRQKFKLSISKKRYKHLVEKKKNKKKMSLKQRKELDQALYVKYCQCLKKFEVEGDKRGYPICINSVYKNRGITPPKNAANNCKVVFNKNI
jgi:hypothetical protein